MESDKVIEAIEFSICDGDVEAVRRLLTEHPAFIHLDYGGTWLHFASHRKSAAIVELLIELGCDVNAEKAVPTRDTPLFCALVGENPVIVRELLEHGANANLGRPVITAIAGNIAKSLELVKLLEEYGADLHRVFVNEHTGEPMNALSAAIDWGKEDVAKYLRSKGAVLPPALAPAAKAESLADEVVAYFGENFGRVTRQTLIEIVPTEPSITVHTIPAVKNHPHVTLFTTGMSVQPMQVPGGGEDFQFAELFIQMPADWRYAAIDDPEHGWPVHWLRSMAKYPHVHDTWLGGPVAIIANGDPPEPIAPNVPFTSMLLLAEKSFVSRNGKTVKLYRMTPLYAEERQLEIDRGIDALMRAFDRENISFVVDPNRPNVGGVR